MKYLFSNTYTKSTKLINSNKVLNNQLIKIQIPELELYKMINEAQTALFKYEINNKATRKSRNWTTLEKDATFMETPSWIRSWSLGDNTDWLNFGFILNGIQIKPNQDVCPTITQWLQQTGPWSIAGLSYLPAGSKINPHVDSNPNNTNTYHLGLVGNGQKCILKVGNKIYYHAAPGAWTVFDDSIIHSAENNSDSDRIILYLKR